MTNLERRCSTRTPLQRGAAVVRGIVLLATGAPITTRTDGPGRPSHRLVVPGRSVTCRCSPGWERPGDAFDDIADDRAAGSVRRGWAVIRSDRSSVRHHDHAAVTRSPLRRGAARGRN